MADVLISTAASTTDGEVCHLDAVDAWNKPKDSAVQVQLSLHGVVMINDMNWELSKVPGTPRIAPLMWFKDAGTHNETGPKVLQLQKDGDGVKVIVKGDVQNQDPAVTSWMVAAMPSDDVRALAAKISQKIDETAWFLKNEGLVGDHTAAKASTATTSWYLQPSKAAPASLSDYLAVTIDPDDSLAAGEAIRRMWNGIANTTWDNVLAPTLLAWLYDFSKTYLENIPSRPSNLESMKLILYGQLYNKTAAYKAYFDSFASGSTPVDQPPEFGSGDPPTADPPHSPGPGPKRPPHPHRPR